MQKKINRSDITKKILDGLHHARDVAKKLADEHGLEFIAEGYDTSKPKKSGS